MKAATTLRFLVSLPNRTRTYKFLEWIYKLREKLFYEKEIQLVEPLDCRC